MRPPRPPRRSRVPPGPVRGACVRCRCAAWIFGDAGAAPARNSNPKRPLGATRCANLGPKTSRFTERGAVTDETLTTKTQAVRMRAGWCRGRGGAGVDGCADGGGRVPGVPGDGLLRWGGGVAAEGARALRGGGRRHSGRVSPCCPRAGSLELQRFRTTASAWRDSRLHVV